ncbi:MAG: RNA polymerase subunit sigma-24 [Flavobacteriales bacterium]|nr:RNA polymerase subunit sigma-24 [Flavobacteriales bacterium]|tara:strand:+ start:2075 stop:2686 length:612 start_codon:yes stop_codon:yes gene_type:complete
MVVPGPNLSEKALYDYNLVRNAIENKSQKAYAELMDRYRDSIYFMLLKMVNNKDDAEDLTIEAFGKAFKKLHQYTPNYAFSTWLFKIASNNCIDFIRKKKKNTFSINKTLKNDEGSELEIDLKSDALDPEQTYMREQKIQIMHDVVRKLKPRYRTLVELRYFKEYSYEEIADHLDIPLGTVKAQLFRAREFLYNIMKNTQEKI